MQTTIIHFEGKLSNRETRYFRSALVDLLGAEHEELHNHESDGVKYSYPIVQYKSIDGNAAVMCFGDSINTLAPLFGLKSVNLVLGHNVRRFSVKEIEQEDFEMEVSGGIGAYSIQGWAPFNSENFKAYLDTPCLIDRVVMLESLLVSNILAMASGLEFHLDEKVACRILDIDKTYAIDYKGTSFKVFDLTFITNVKLPEYAGLGKHVSIGAGVVKSMNSL